MSTPPPSPCIKLAPPHPQAAALDSLSTAAAEAELERATAEHAEAARKAEADAATAAAATAVLEEVEEAQGVRLVAALVARAVAAAKVTAAAVAAEEAAAAAALLVMIRGQLEITISRLPTPDPMLPFSLPCVDAAQRQRFINPVDLVQIQLGELLGKGGFASVFKGTADFVRGPVAVKVSILDGEVQRNASLNEAVAMLQLRQAKPITTLGVYKMVLGPGPEPGQPYSYLVMQLADETLEHRLAEMLVEVGETLGWGRGGVS